MPQEILIRDSDNELKFILTNDGIPIAGIWNQLDIFIGDVNINRTADGDGISLSVTTGELVIRPGDLTAPEKAALDLLTTKVPQKVTITVYSIIDDDGSVWGIAGDKLDFKIADKP